MRMRAAVVYAVFFLAIFAAITGSPDAGRAETIWTKDGDMLNVTITRITAEAVWYEAKEGDVVEETGVDKDNIARVFNNDGSDYDFKETTAQGEAPRAITRSAQAGAPQTFPIPAAAYDVTAEESARAVITGTETDKALANRIRFRVRVNQGGGERLYFLGPLDYLERFIDISQFSAGKEVELVYCVYPVTDRFGVKFFNTRKIRIADKEIIMRDEQGKPLWQRIIEKQERRSNADITK